MRFVIQESKKGFGTRSIVAESGWQYVADYSAITGLTCAILYGLSVSLQVDVWDEIVFLLPPAASASGAIWLQCRFAPRICYIMNCARREEWAITTLTANECLVSALHVPILRMLFPLRVCFPLMALLMLFYMSVASREEVLGCFVCLLIGYINLLIARSVLWLLARNQLHGGERSGWSILIPFVGGALTAVCPFWLLQALDRIFPFPACAWGCVLSNLVLLFAAWATERWLWRRVLRDFYVFE
ncbi:MAG: hypothetical protein NTX50_21290 [Candidatus Sumerlaeota bacterium]|nr:hypothetical protein [Candidatus Sumerlaeota bacterium]